MRCLYESDQVLGWVGPFRDEEMSVAAVVQFERLLTKIFLMIWSRLISVSGSKEETNSDKNDLK